MVGCGHSHHGGIRGQNPENRYRQGHHLAQDSPYREPINLVLLQLIVEKEYRRVYEKWVGGSP